LEVLALYRQKLPLEQQTSDIHTKDHPNVSIKPIAIADSELPAHNARIAAGTASDIMTLKIDNQRLNTSANENFVNWLEVDCKYWDRCVRDIRNQFNEDYALEEQYIPVLNPCMAWYMTFVYHGVDMGKDGVNPRETVRTCDDLDSFLAMLKQYVDTKKEPKAQGLFSVGSRIEFLDHRTLQTWGVSLDKGIQRFRDVLGRGGQVDGHSEQPVRAGLQEVQGVLSQGVQAHKAVGEANRRQLPGEEARLHVRRTQAL
jgi:hypothetical protein